jgi:hypothetical protein
LVSKLGLVLKELNDNGNFRASLFATSAGLVLSFQKEEGIDERVVAAMGSLLSDAAYKASDISESTKFLLAVLTKLPETEEIEKYIDQLLDWAEENSKGDLQKLSSL